MYFYMVLQVSIVTRAYPNIILAVKATKKYI